MLVIARRSSRAGSGYPLIAHLHKGNGPVDWNDILDPDDPMHKASCDLQEPPVAAATIARAHTHRRKGVGGSDSKLFPYSRGAAHLRVASGADRADGARGDSLARASWGPEGCKNAPESGMRSGPGATLTFL